MAGLCAAARARELGGRPVVFEKGSRPGGSMRISSCVIWRYRTFERFRAECPGGDPSLQRQVFEHLDDGLDWLESLGVDVVYRETGNELTTGVRFEPESLTEALVRGAGEVRLEASAAPSADEAVILATGGFQGNPALVAEYVAPAAPLSLRANRWSTGAGLGAGLERGATLSGGMGEFYGRNMPDADVSEHAFVTAAQLYARHALVLNEHGHEFLRQPVSWSETEVVQATAQQPGASAWYLVTDEALRERVRGRTVSDMVATAEAAGGTVLNPCDLPFPTPAGLVRGVRVRAAITHTIGGLRIDERARVLAGDGSPIEGLYACGADVGGISTGGYASGLAAALVFGRIAAENALS
ncbi:MAG: FAD-binding protein [Actinobacteria bacterium]|nr:FAD-binding protein [Actinomycetota bacterium]